MATENNDDGNAPDPFKGFVTHETVQLAEGVEAVPTEEPANSDEGNADEDSSADDVGGVGDDLDPDYAGDPGDGADDDADDTGDDTRDGADDDDDADDTGDDAPGDDDASDVDSSEEEPRKKKKLTISQRMAQLTKKARVAERGEAAAVAVNTAKDARIAELEAKLTPPADDATQDDTTSDDDTGKPKAEDFTYGELDPNFVEALTDWTVEKRLSKRDKEHEATRQDEAAQTKAAEIVQQLDDKIVEGVEAYTDFQEVVVDAGDAGDYPLTPETAMMGLESDVGHHVLYEIATNLPLAKKISQMTPMQQAREFGRLEAQYRDKDTPKPKKTTNTAPPPSKKSGGQGAKPFNAATASFADFEKYQNERLRQQ